MSKINSSYLHGYKKCTSLQLFSKIKIQTRALYCIIKAINKTIRKEMSLYLPLIIHEKFCLGQTEILDGNICTIIPFKM